LYVFKNGDKNVKGKSHSDLNNPVLSGKGGFSKNKKSIKNKSPELLRDFQYLIFTEVNLI